MKYNPISGIIGERFPTFVKSEYEQFALFMRDYFEHLESNGNFLDILHRFESNCEANNESEVYIDKILADLGWDVAIPIQISKSELVHHLRDFYLSRGNLNSVKFLFRAIFNSNVDVRYPRERLFTTSTAEYSRQMFIFVDAKSINDNIALYNILLEESKTFGIQVEGRVSRTLASVEDIEFVSYAGKLYLKVRISPLQFKEFISNENVRIFSDTAEIVEELIPPIKINVINPGYGYITGDRVDVAGALLHGAAEVTKIVPGDINAVNIINGGIGYKVGDRVILHETADGHSFSAAVESVDISGTITSIYIYSSGYDFYVTPGAAISSTTGHGAIVTCNSNSIGRIEEVSLIEPLLYKSGVITTATVTSLLGQGAELIVSSTPIFESDYKFRDNRGILGHSAVLTDSYKYQQFSYELLSNINASITRPIINDLVHPAGLVRFDVIQTVIESIFDIKSISLVKSVQANIRTDITYDREFISSTLNNRSFNIVLRADEYPSFRESNMEHFKFSTNLDYNSNYFGVHISGFYDNKIYFDEALQAQVDIFAVGSRPV